MTATAVVPGPFDRSPASGRDSHDSTAAGGHTYSKFRDGSLALVALFGEVFPHLRAATPVVDIGEMLARLGFGLVWSLSHLVVYDPGDVRLPGAVLTSTRPLSR